VSKPVHHLGHAVPSDPATNTKLGIHEPLRPRLAILTIDENDFRYQKRIRPMARNELRPLVKLRSTGGTGFTYVTRKNRRNDPNRLVLRKYDPVLRRHVDLPEER